MSSNTREELSLSELGNRIKGVIRSSLDATYWVRAEMSDVHIHASGHCYLEFVEKHPRSGLPVAKIRASIWAKTFYMLKPYFENETGQAFASGLKVLVNAAVEYHELYGLSLNVLDIDPTYTVGDMLRKRMEIIRRLKEEGVFTLNRELPFPVLPKRIAIVTSPTAAGYEDFVNQLEGNKAGYTFHFKLFPAVMQGEKTESSVIAALDRIFRHADCFDLAVIIRGGGATSELSSFDSYLLAANCAQFPLPVVTGIGHERDDTVLDFVAHTRMKTPTAVAEFLISRMDEAAGEVNRLQQYLAALASEHLQRAKNGLQTLGSRLPLATFNLLNKHSHTLQACRADLTRNLRLQTAGKSHFLNLTEQFILMASPEYILKRGYSLTLKDGKIMKRSAPFSPGDEITTRFTDGEVKSRVTQITPSEA